MRLWSILNEVDLTGYPADRYASLYTRSRQAIRRFAGRRARVLWGEFSPHHPIRYSVKALAASPARVVADGFALHPYRSPGDVLQDWKGWLRNLGDVKRNLAGLARRKRKSIAPRAGNRLPIYGTEYGCSTRKYDERECARQWNEGLTQASRHGLRQLVAYQLVPADQPSWDTSLLRRDGLPSRAMQLISHWTRGS